jgi:hypothetical protein
MGRLGLGPEPASAQGPPIKPPPKRTAGTGSDRVGDAVRGMRQRGLEERGFEGVDRSAWQSLAQQLGVREALLQPIVDESERAAEAFVSPWDKALVHIKDEVTQTGGLFGDLANAWAEGGVAGLAKLATAKVKENLARAIEMGAIALGQLVFGNTAGATLAAKSAATHAAAVPAWAALGAAVGGSGSKSAPTGGSFPSIGSTNTRNAADITQSAQVHIYIDPLNPDDPAYQRSVAAATKNAQERYGANTQVHIHRRRSG